MADAGILYDTMLRRKSVREFQKGQLSAERLAEIAEYVQGIEPLREWSKS